MVEACYGAHMVETSILPREVEQLSALIRKLGSQEIAARSTKKVKEKA